MMPWQEDAADSLPPEYAYFAKCRATRRGECKATFYNKYDAMSETLWTLFHGFAYDSRWRQAFRLGSKFLAQRRRRLITRRAADILRRPRADRRAVYLITTSFSLFLPRPASA